MGTGDGSPPRLIARFCCSRSRCHGRCRRPRSQHSRGAWADPEIRAVTAAGLMGAKSVASFRAGDPLTAQELENLVFDLKHAARAAGAGRRRAGRPDRPSRRHGRRRRPCPTTRRTTTTTGPLDDDHDARPPAPAAPKQVANPDKAR